MNIFFAGPENTIIANEDSGFIKSLALAADSHAGLRVVDDAQGADVIAVDERYSYKTWTYAQVLLSCPFIQRFGGRIAVLNHDDQARVFLPGLYVSLEQSRPPLVPALPIPYKRDLWKIEIADFAKSEGGKYLWTFRGSCRTHPVRRKIWAHLHRDPRGAIDVVDREFHSHSKEDQAVFASSLLSGDFSLCPRGFSPSTYRVFESMQLGRCPVVVSDDWLAPAAIDWGACSLRVHEADVGRLAEILESNRGSASELGRNARAEWERRLAWPVRLHGFLDSVISVARSPKFGTSIEEISSLWGSARFRDLYDWTLPGRLKSRIKRQIESVERRRFEFRLSKASNDKGVLLKRGGIDNRISGC